MRLGQQHVDLDVERLCGQLRMLADRERLQLLARLTSFPCSEEVLSTALGLDRKTVRQHIDALDRAGLVREVREGEYVLVPEALASLGFDLGWLNKPPVISFVARSGTGKTTFLETLIPELRTRGLRVGVLKHHAHNTPFDVPGKDSYRLSQAGADIVVGACAVQVAIFRQEDGAVDLDRVIARHLGGTDLVLTEGFKRGGHPKIEVHRAACRAELRCTPDELLALVTDEPLDIDVPQFGLGDAAAMADFLLTWLCDPC